MTVSDWFIGLLIRSNKEIIASLRPDPAIRALRLPAFAYAGRNNVCTNDDGAALPKRPHRDAVPWAVQAMYPVRGDKSVKLQKVCG
jgi:hypothetical protein